MLIAQKFDLKACMKIFIVTRTALKVPARNLITHLHGTLATSS